MKHFPVRIEKAELSQIIDTIQDVSKDLNLKKIGIFGSRTDLNKTGGDLDLYIEISKENVNTGQLASLIRVLLWEKIGEQKIDIFIWNVLDKINTKRSKSFRDMIWDEVVFVLDKS